MGLYFQMLGDIHAQSFKAIANLKDAGDMQTRIGVFQRNIAPLNPDIRLMVFAFEHVTDTNFSEQGFGQMLNETRVDIDKSSTLPLPVR